MSVSLYNMVISSISFHTHVLEATHRMCSVFREQRRRAARSHVHVFFILSLTHTHLLTHTHTQRPCTVKGSLRLHVDVWSAVSVEKSAGASRFCDSLLVKEPESRTNQVFCEKHSHSQCIASYKQTHSCLVHGFSSLKCS